MKARIKLYGNLRKYYPDYNSTSGIDIEIPDGTKIRDLIQMLNISKDSVGIVSMDGILVKAGDHVNEGAEVKIFQPISGG